MCISRGMRQFYGLGGSKYNDFIAKACLNGCRSLFLAV